MAQAATNSASPAGTVNPLITQREDISDQGLGNYLASCGTIGNQVEFIGSPGACFIVQWNYQIQSNGQYYLHPSNNNNYCLTIDTSNDLYLKIETCVGKWNQYFTNPNDGQGDYQIHNTTLNENVEDTGIPGESTWAEMWPPEDYGGNGQTMYEPA